MAITDLAVSFTPIPGGAFPGGYADNDAGGYHIVATTAARNALPTYLRIAGMLAFVQAGAGTLWQLKASPWLGTDADWSPFSAGLSRATYDMLNGEESTELTTANPQVIGAIYFDPNAIIPVSSGRTRHVDFECVIESSIVTSLAILDLYDVTGISTGGTPGVVANSTKQTTNLAPTRFTQNFDVELGAITTAGLIEARLAIQIPGPSFATCKLARLIVTWE